jgi:hypothetical protein
MLHSLKTIFLSFVALLFILLTLFWFGPLYAEGTQGQGHLAALRTSVLRSSVTKSRMLENAKSNGPYCHRTQRFAAAAIFCFHRNRQNFGFKTLLRF